MDGAGAEQYLLREPEEPPFDGKVPLLYATTSGAPYERFEIQRLQGPVWPNGLMEYKIRLFAEDETVVEQYFHVARLENGQLGLLYGDALYSNNLPTTENGQSVAVPYSILDSEVTFAAAPPWRFNAERGPEAEASGDGPIFMTLARGRNENVVIAADPLPRRGCDSGPAAADAEALARRIMADPDFETIGTTPVRIAGIEGLQMDVVVAAGDVCFWTNWVLEVQPTIDTGYAGFRMRLYLIDYPGDAAQVLTIAVIAPEEAFERVLDAATPIVDSLEIHSG